MSRDHARRIVADQERYIRARFGDEAADVANYGWFGDDGLGYVETKVYGYGVLSSTVSVIDDTTIRHEFVPFRKATP